MPTKKPIIQVVLPTKYHEQLKQIAQEEERSISFIAGRIIEDYLKEHGEIIAAENKIVEIRKSLDPFA